AIVNAASLLGINQVLIDLAGMFKGLADGALRDFVEGHALDARGIAILILIFIFTLFGLLLFPALVIKLAGQVRSDSFAFAVRVRREEDVVGSLSQLLQLGEDLFFARNDDVFGVEL